MLPKVDEGLAEAFGRATRALTAGLPTAVARQRMLEVMHWLLEAGVALSAPLQERLEFRQLFGPERLVAVDVEPHPIAAERLGEKQFGVEAGGRDTALLQPLARPD